MLVKNKNKIKTTVISTSDSLKSNDLTYDTHDNILPPNHSLESIIEEICSNKGVSSSLRQKLIKLPATILEQIMQHVNFQSMFNIINQEDPRSLECELKILTIYSLVKKLKHMYGISFATIANAKFILFSLIEEYKISKTAPRYENIEFYELKNASSLEDFLNHVNSLSSELLILLCSHLGDTLTCFSKTIYLIILNILIQRQEDFRISNPSFFSSTKFKNCSYRMFLLAIKFRLNNYILKLVVLGIIPSFKDITSLCKHCLLLKSYGVLNEMIKFNLLFITSEEYKIVVSTYSQPSIIPSLLEYVIESKNIKIFEHLLSIMSLSKINLKNHYGFYLLQHLKQQLSEDINFYQSKNTTKINKMILVLEQKLKS